MPIEHDIMDHAIIGPAIRQGLEVGRQLGREEARAEWMRDLVRRLIEQRFGPLDAKVELRLLSLNSAALLDFAPRILDARAIDDLLT